jgi:CelD/BcsL family acetyltransferase involved in cellulose biosynthesis
VATGGDRLDTLLEEGYRLEGSGWKAREGTAIQSRPETRAFYGEVARWAAEQGSLRLSFLRLDGRAIAFHFNVEANDVQYHLKGGYDTDYERFSPGRLLHYLLLERCFDGGLRRYDFLGGEEPYKLQFATGTRVLARLQAFAPSAAGRLERAAHVYVRPLARRLLARVGRT